MSRRKQKAPEPPAAPGIREAIATVNGVDVVLRIYPDGTERVDRIAEGAAVETLSHSFPNCPTCEGQHLSVDGEPIDCPRIGWVGGPAGIPVYPGPPRTLDFAEQEAGVFNRAHSSHLNHLARLIERQTGEKV